jgi:sugar/nucleoside kinase (ribokinase family)
MMERSSLVRKVLSLANKHGTVVAFDMSTVELAEERAQEIVTYARAYPVILFLNEDEARAFYHSMRGEEDERGVDILSRELSDFYRSITAGDLFPVITIKLGVRGAIVFAGGSVYREETIPVIPLETTGAGDAFCAAFLAAWIRDKSLSDCASLGNKAARVVLDSTGVNPDPGQLAPFRKLLENEGAS